MSDDSPVEPARPVLRVVRGEPSPEELAALVAVLAARGSGGVAADEHATLSQWRNRGRNIRPPQGVGPEAWRASGLPR